MCGDHVAMRGGGGKGEGNWGSLSPSHPESGP